MLSQKPYLIRAIYEWCQDSNLTPHLVAMVDKQTKVPVQYVTNQQIVLNIAFSATKNLLIENDWITFQATFGGIIQNIAIPIGNVVAIFAQENRQGMQFEVGTTSKQASSNNPTTSTNKLKLIK